MTDEEYRKYLSSPGWAEKAKARLEFDGYVCQGCGCRGSVIAPLQVHHLSYERVGNEDIEWDLVSLCP